MNRGYVKLWRKSADAGWLQNHKLWVFWTYCLMKASHREYDAIVGNQTIHLIPGQFVFGRKKAAEDTALSEQEVRTTLQFLVRSKNLTIKTTNKFSIITIINWDTYQGEEIEINQQINQPLTNKEPTNNQQITTYKHNNTKEEDISSAEPTISDRCPHLKIIKIYNETLPQLPAVKPHLWGGIRERSLQARWKEREERQSAEWWRGFFEYIRNDCAFLLGENDKGWKADLGWILKRDNFVKISEGKYCKG